MDKQATNELTITALLDAIALERNLSFEDGLRNQALSAIQTRMAELGADKPENYKDRLQAHPGEYNFLFKAMLTPKSFLVDEPVWAVLSKILSEKLIDRERSNLRAWIIGCNSGHEAYGLAIGLAQLFGNNFASNRCKIFATSQDEEALIKERQGIFEFDTLNKIFPPDFVGKYFTGEGKTAVFRTDLRRSIIFGRHDVTKDPPISKMDLIICRQVLPVFNQEVQNKTVAHLLGALNEQGCLILGDCERIADDIDTRPSNSASYIFQKSLLRQPSKANVVPDAMSDFLGKNTKLIEASADASAPATVCITEAGIVASINSQARNMFNLVPQDIGKLLQDLEISYRPIELRSLIELAQKDGKPTIISSIARIDRLGKNQILDVHIHPLRDDTTSYGAHIQFHDVTAMFTLQEEVVNLNQQLQTANEELQSAHEELETTNEELQSTNEELETTNEELQSTNEELETMNEELQSTNSELEFSNGGQQELVTAADRVNAFFEAILGSMHSAVTVLDSDQNIRIWNQHCTELWGLRENEVVGSKLVDLDIGFPVESLRKPMANFKDSSGDQESFKVDAINRRGMKIRCDVKIVRLTDGEGMMVVIDDEKLSDE
jgi:two-component system, chemotaxis family, CheB/CheR fusion protein